MDDISLPGTQQAAGLVRLTETERRVLLLLAEGHTAKSIANTIGATEAAVNERLREARRKTGVGSSRELARLLKAQESRGEGMGAARPTSRNAFASPSEAELWRPQIGVFAMTVALLVTAAAAAALMSQDAPSSPAVDPLVGAPIERFPQTADLHAMVRAEPRDPVWAAPMEERIRVRVSQIPFIGEGGNVLRVTCATTMCEIAGSIMEPASKQQWDERTAPFNVAIADLQDAPFAKDLEKLGLKSESGTFTGAKNEPRRSVFLLYYSRVEARPK